MKISVNNLIKIGGLLLTVAGSVVTGIANKKDTDKTLAKLVEEKLKNK